MPQRIYEAYDAGDRVEIVFANRSDDQWQAAVVLRREPPGIWVRAADGREWFMTNTYRIRPAQPLDPER